MLKNIFALIGAAVVTAKTAKWYMEYRELQEDNDELKSELNQRKANSPPSSQT